MITYHKFSNVKQVLAYLLNDIEDNEKMVAQWLRMESYDQVYVYSTRLEHSIEMFENIVTFHVGCGVDMASHTVADRLKSIKLYCTKKNIKNVQRNK